MNKKAKVSFVLLFSVFLSACTTPKPATTNSQTDPNTKIETEQSQSMSIRDLLAVGKNQECTITSSTTNDDGTKTDTSGKIYLSGKKMAQEVVVTSTDNEIPKINIRVISDGDYIYTWNAETKAQGMKIKITESEKNATGDSNKSGGISMNDKLNVKCTSWLVDNNKFSIPDDIQFSDLSEMMKNIPTPPTSLPKN